MLTALRAVALAGCSCSSDPIAGHRRAVSGDTTALEFLGFRAGARLEELNLRLGIAAARCAAGNPRPIAGFGVPGSATQGKGGPGRRLGVGDRQPGRSNDVVRRWLRRSWGTGRTLSKAATARSATRVQGTQRMLQWVRRGRMIRLTWRAEAGQQVASVSLVDGQVLDNWGRSRSAEPSSRRARVSTGQSDQIAALGVLQQSNPELRLTDSLSARSRAPDPGPNRRPPPPRPRPVISRTMPPGLALAWARRKRSALATASSDALAVRGRTSRRATAVSPISELRCRTPNGGSAWSLDLLRRRR